jgi:hypothetical protein
VSAERRAGVGHADMSFLRTLTALDGVVPANAGTHRSSTRPPIGLSAGFDLGLASPVVPFDLPVALN